jgi:hypothetical protein
MSKQKSNKKHLKITGGSMPQQKRAQSKVVVNSMRKRATGTKGFLATHKKLAFSIAIGVVVLAIGLALFATYAAGSSGTVKALGKCLDNTYGVKKNGNAVMMYGCDGTDTQVWTLSGDKIKFGSTQYCLDVQNAAKTAQSLATLWRCSTDTSSKYYKSQQWTVRSDGSILNKNSGLCLTVKNGSTTEGTPVWLFVCNGSASQKWTVPTPIIPLPTPSPSPTPAPAPSPGPTPTPTPTTSGSSTCPLPAYPSASCTGVPAGTSLATVNGDINVTASGTLIENKDIRGCITVSPSAKAVVIRKSKITCTSSPWVILHEDQGPDSDANRLRIEDSEVSCGITNHTAIAEANITAVRLNISGCENGFDMNQNVTVQDSYIHDMAEVGTDPHTDGIQMAIGHSISGNNYANGALNISIVHNYIVLHGTSAIISNRNGYDTNILVQDNLLAGGAYTLYCDQSGTHGTNYRVINNHFSTVLYPKVGAYGPLDDCQDETQFTGNVYHETGLPL